MAVRHIAAVLAVFTALVTLSTSAGAQAPPCTENLKILHRGLTAYAADNNGHLPDRLSLLYPRYVIELFAFWCPEDRQGERSAQTIDSDGSFRLAADSIITGSTDPLLVERQPRHDDIRAILAHDGTVYLERAPQISYVVQPHGAGATAARQNEPPTVRFLAPVTEWSVLDEVVFSWEGEDDQTPANELQFRVHSTVSDMSPWGPQTAITLGRVRAGDHSVEVWVRDGDGLISVEPARIRFTVQRASRPAHFPGVVGGAKRKPISHLPPPPVWADDPLYLRRIELRDSAAGLRPGQGPVQIREFPPGDTAPAEDDANDPDAAAMQEVPFISIIEDVTEAVGQVGVFLPGETDTGVCEFPHILPFIHVLLWVEPEEHMLPDRLDASLYLAGRARPVWHDTLEITGRGIVDIPFFSLRGRFVPGIYTLRLRKGETLLAAVSYRVQLAPQPVAGREGSNNVNMNAQMYANSRKLPLIYRIQR